MKTKRLLTQFACSATLAVPSICQAHFLWVSVDPTSKTASVSFQEVPEQAPLPLGARAHAVRAWLPGGKKLNLKADETGLRTTSAGPALAAVLDYGVVDRRDAGRGVFWLKYYAKGATNLAASQVILDLPVELTAARSAGGETVVTVLLSGKPALGADVVVEDATGKQTFEGKTGPDGTTTLPKSQGPLEVRALVTDPTPGTNEGKPYELVRSYSTLWVTDPSSEPLTGLLRKSFGDKHEVVSHSAFIETVMAGKLTKSQLADHLEQRALIHEAIDSELRRASLDKALYGPDQRQVLTLLRSNLETLGLRWPRGSAALPLTRSFLDQIEASRKQGPYFALGAFHVYYGGITHGGRDIGATIDQSLGTSLSYYEKSDGYAPYARAVDGITDPAARQEMIRGADEAYRYIIAVDNLDIFKASNPGD